MQLLKHLLELCGFLFAAVVLAGIGALISVLGIFLGFVFTGICAVVGIAAIAHSWWTEKK